MAALDSVLTSVHVGVGGRGRAHLRVFTESPLFRPVALVDISDEFLAQARELTGLPESACFGSLEDAVERTRPDVVVVVTPSRLHTQFVRAALEAGKHVYVEKPFTCDLAEAQELVELAEQRGLRIMVTQNDRYANVYRTMRRLLAEETYGAAGFCTMVHYKARGAPYPYSQHMHLWQQGVHQIDTLLAVLQRRPRRVLGWSVQPAWEDWPSPSTVSALIECEGPVYATYMGTSNARANDFQFRVECERGALISRGYGQQGRLFLATREGEQPLELDPPLPHSPEHELAQQFYRYVTEGVEPPTSGRRNLTVLAVLDAIQRCTETGQAVVL